MVQAFVPIYSAVWAAQQLPNARFPFIDSKEWKTLHVASHHCDAYSILYPIRLPTGQKLTCTSVKCTRMWRLMAEEWSSCFYIVAMAFQ